MVLWMPEMRGRSGSEKVVDDVVGQRGSGARGGS